MIDTEKAFNPSSHIIQISTTQGKKDYLPVQYRLVWFRSECPEGTITTELLDLNRSEECETEVSVWNDEKRKYEKIIKRARGVAVFRATVTDGKGGSATGTKTENAASFADYLEKAECVPLDSEIFTRQGFKKYDKLTIGEEVLAYDAKTDRCVWTPLQRVVTYPDAPLVRLYGKCFEAYCTPEHTWPVYYTANWKGKKYEYRKLVPTNQLAKSHRIILSAPGPDGDHPLTAQDAAILGWLMTDGSFHHQGNCVRSYICQSKQGNVAAIRDLAGALATESVHEVPARTFPAGHTSDCLPQHRFTFNADETRRLLHAGGFECSQDMPSAVIQYSQDARSAMLNAMMLGDGDKRGYFGKKRKPGVMEAWQNIATLEGYALSAMYTSTVGDVPLQKLKKRRTLCASELEIEPVGNAPVWCPTTAYGTWVMRQNGRIMITGNTGAIGRALAALGYGTQFTGDELDEGNDRIADAPVHRSVPQQERQPAKPLEGAITSQQKDAILSMYSKLGKKEAPDLSNWSAQQAAEAIKQLQVEWRQFNQKAS